MSIISAYKNADPAEKKRMLLISLAIAGLAICLCISACGWMLLKFSTLIKQIAESDLGNAHLIPWIVSGYIICEIGAIPLSGKLVDQYGERRVLIVGLALFVIGTLVCILAGDVNWLVVGRCIEGAGAGTMFAVAFTSVGTLIKNHHRGLGHEVMTAAFAIGSLFGTATGWFLISNTKEFDTPFYFLLILAIIGGALALYGLPRREINKGTSDIEGAIIVSLLFLLIVAYTQHERRLFDFVSPTSAMWILCIIALGFLLYHVEIHVKNPAFPMGMSRTKAKMFVIMILLCMFSLGIFQFMLKYALLAIYPFDIYGASTLFLFLLAGGAITSVPGCKLVTKTGLRPWMLLGATLIIAGFICFLTFGLESENGMRISFFVLGTGLGCMVTELLCMMQAITPKQDMGKYSSGLMGTRMAAIVVGSALFNNVIMDYIENKVGQDLESGDIFELIIRIIMEGKSVLEEVIRKVIEMFQDSLHICIVIIIIAVAVIFVLGFLFKKEDLEEQAENDRNESE